MSPDVIKVVAVSVLLFAVFVVMPVIYMLMEHQRKMIRLLRGEQVDESDTETFKILMGVNPAKALPAEDVKALTERVRALESEIALLKATQAQQEIELQQRTR